MAGQALDVFKPLAEIVKYVPDKLVLGAVIIFAVLGVLTLVLRAEVLTLLSPEVRDELAKAIVRYVMTGALVVMIISFAWAIMTGTSTASKLEEGYRSQAEVSGVKSIAIRPSSGDIVSLTRYLVELSGRLNPPSGIEEALTKLAAGDPLPAYNIVLQDAQKQTTDKAKAQILRQAGLLAFYSDTTKALEAYQEAVRLEPENADGLTQLALLLERRGEHAGAEAAARKALAIGTSQNDQKILGAVYNVLGAIAHNRGDFQGAKDPFEKSRAAFKAAGANTDYALATRNLARAYYALAEYEPALGLYKEALGVDTAANNERGIAADNIGLAEIATQRNDVKAAIESYEAATLTVDRLNDRTLAALVWSGLGTAYRRRGAPGDLDLAMRAHQRALELQDSLGSDLGASLELSKAGEIALDRGDFPAAEIQFQRALDRAGTNNPLAQVVAQRGLGEARFQQDKFAAARAAFEAAGAIDQTIPGSGFYLALDDWWLGIIFRKLNIPDQACAAWSQAAAIYSRLQKASNLQRVREAMTEANCPPAAN